MNENLDLTELLKDCPEGTKFYSSYLGKDVFFIGIHNNDIECKYPPKINSPFDCMIEFRKNGSLRKDGECMLFPSKDQRDWSKWHRPFVDGDIAVSKSGNLIGIVKISCSDDDCYGVYVVLDNWGEYPIIYDDTKIYFSRLATEEEKQKLFDAIKANGYRWNSETKTLEKLIVPKFKVGDSIQSKTNNNNKFTITNIDNDGFYYGCGKNGRGKMCEYMIPIKKQDDWILIPNKFDPKPLKHFDKVLCRMNNDDIWGISLFERYAPTNPYPFFCIQDCFSQCVPYNDNTKHLVGTNNEAPEYYKCWED